MEADKNADKPAAERRSAKTGRTSKASHATATQKSEGIWVSGPGLPPKRSIERNALVAIAIVVILAAVFSALFYGLVAYKPTSFKAFASNFNRANSVAVYVNYTNGTEFAPELSCSNALIEELISSSAVHKNASQISLYILYNNSCVYRQGALGTLISNYTNATRSECISYGTGKPSIFINYSRANSTVITPEKLYFTGDAKFLSECGIAYQIT